MQGTGRQRAWSGSGSPSAPRGPFASGSSGWMPNIPSPFFLLPTIPQAGGPRLGQQLSSVASPFADPITPSTIRNIPSRYRQSRRAGDRSLYAPVDRRVNVQAAGSSPSRQDSGGFGVCSEGNTTRHSGQPNLRGPSSRLEQRGVATVHGSSSAARMSRHGPEPFNERWPANTMGRRLSGDDSHVPTRRTADSMFEGLAASFNSMEFVDDQVGGTGLRTLPTVEEMEARMRRSSENSFLGRAARQYGAARGLSSNRGFPFVSALQRPGSNATNHRSQSYEPRPPVSVIDERYLWTGDRSRPRRSGGESSEFLTGSRSEEASLFGNLFGESLGARLHRSVAANMVRSFLSSMAGPVAIPWPGPWEVRMGLSLGAAHRPEHHRHSRRVLAGPNSSLVLFAAASADPAAFDVLDHNVWRFMQEVERRFAFEDLDELDTPLMLVVSGGHAGDGDDVVSHIWADTSENRVTLQQLSEARSLVDALDRHTIKWTFGGAKESDAHPTTASHMMEAPARTRGGTPQQMRRGLGARDASRDTAADSSAAGAKIGTHNGYDCCICLSAFEPGDALLTLRCFHIFHERCIERWIKTSHSIKCPLCSTKIADSPRTDHFDE